MIRLPKLLDEVLGFVLVALSLLIGAALVLVFVVASAWTVVEIVGGWL